MAALTADRNVTHLTSKELRQFLCDIDIIYRGGFVGLHPVTKYAKAFEPGDIFVGIAYENVDNSGGSAGDEKVRVYVDGDFEHALSSAAIADAGKPVYATDDSTLALLGHPDAFVGYIIHRDVDTTTNVVVRLKQPGEKPPKDGSSLDYSYAGQGFTPTGAVAATNAFGDGLLCKSILGLGNVAIDGSATLNPACKLQFDAVAEIALASIRTPGVFQVDQGITMAATLHLENIGDAAALDTDWGFVHTLDTTTEANLDDATATQLATFHMDGNSANILVQSDDATTDVAAVDSTSDNVATDAAASFKDFFLLVRKNGNVTFWIDGTQILSSTTFALLSTAVVYGIINMEKTSDDTVAELNLASCRFAGAGAQSIG